MVKQVLQADYPSFNIVTCPGETSPNDDPPASGTAPPTTTPAASAAACAAMVTNSTIVYQDQVSYWYAADTDDPLSGSYTAAGDMPTDDLDPMNTLDLDTGGTADVTGADGGPSAGSEVCPASGQLGRKVTVQVWTNFNSPFGSILGISHQGLSTNASSYGCGG